MILGSRCNSLRVMDFRWHRTAISWIAIASARKTWIGRSPFHANCLEIVDGTSLTTQKRNESVNESRKVLNDQWNSNTGPPEATRDVKLAFRFGVQTDRSFQPQYQRQRASRSEFRTFRLSDAGQSDFRLCGQHRRQEQAQVVSQVRGWVNGNSRLLYSTARKAGGTETAIRATIDSEVNRPPTGSQLQCHRKHRRVQNVAIAIRSRATWQTKGRDRKRNSMA